MPRLPRLTDYDGYAYMMFDVAELEAAPYEEGPEWGWMDMEAAWNPWAPIDPLPRRKIYLTDDGQGVYLIPEVVAYLRERGIIP